MSNHGVWIKGVGFGIGSAITFAANCTVAQIMPIIADQTLPINSKVSEIKDNTISITGGTPSGKNLFHSFEQFSIPAQITAEFKNVGEVQNIITRVTGNSISHINGTLKAQSTANLFLINPNGIIFGTNAALDIGGSFLASTASSINFFDGTRFSATAPQSTPLLSVNIPIGLQFGATAAPILNQSQVTNSDTPVAVGLQVKPSRGLALVGGNITLEGGSLTAESGRIELGSVAPNSLVTVQPINQGWALGYEGVQNFQNIQVLRSTDGSGFSSIVNTSGERGGSIQLQGKTVLLSGNRVTLVSRTRGNSNDQDTNGQDIKITAENLIIRDGAQINNLSIGNGSAGNIIVNASESVKLIGNATLTGTPTGLSNITGGVGNAGNISISTKKLQIQNIAGLTVASGASRQGSTTVLAEGNAGSINVNAWESVEIAGNLSGLSASTGNIGDAGIINITTGQLIVRDGGQINVNVDADPSENPTNLATPGQINVTADSILLDNIGKFQAQSTSGRGGNITLNVRDVLLLRRGSQISASAGTAQTGGDGGNISINAPNGFVVAVPNENSDITANAFSGSGGRIAINARSIFGFLPRTRADLERLLNTTDPNKLDPGELQTSDITAFSLQNPFLGGTVEINTPDVDPSKGIVELPTSLIDAAQQITAGCNPGEKLARGSLVATGRGGLASSPREPLMSNDAVAADWISLKPNTEYRVDGVENKVELQKQSSISVHPDEIVKAQGWVIDADGNVVLVAQPPTVISHNPTLTSASCLEK